jgi:uncharacterized membrane protein (DUF4010 family)
MSESTRLIFEQLGIALALGALVGLQRQRSESLVAGLRTFPLITMLGTLAAALDAARAANGWIVAAGLIALVAVVVAGYRHRLEHDGSGAGMTTEAAILLMYLVGAYIVLGDRVAAIAVGAGVAVLLQFKPELHGIAARLGDADLRAIMTFALITCIILPILPDETYDLVSPLNVLNPFRIWLMVVLMVGISLGGYLIYKFLGRAHGILVTGLIGGMVSSTATTVSYARRSRDSEDSARLAALAILLASSVVYVRVLLEISVVAPQEFTLLAGPIGVMLLASVVPAAMIYWKVQSEQQEMPQQKNPTELKSALVFAGLYAGVLMALDATQTYLGGQGLYVVAFLSGLTDMDAITLSTARLVQLDSAAGGISTGTGWRLIVTATIANLIFKWLICLTLGGQRLAVYVAWLFAIPAATGLALIMLWP